MMKGIGAGVLLLVTVGGVVGQAPERGAFVATLGDDTIAVESFTRTAERLSGVSVTRTPSTLVRRYTVELGPGGSPRTMRIATRPVSGSVAQEVTYEYGPDSVRITVHRDTVERHLSVAASGAPYPFSESIYGPWELALARALASGESMPILAGRRVFQYALTRRPDGRIEAVGSEGGEDFSPLGARLDARGRLQQFDLRGTTDKYLAVRVDSVDVDALAAAFAARDRQGGGVGVLSPRDTAAGEISGAHVAVDYGRPSARGRQVFGGIVPWNVVWRTGANEATQLITDRELVIGGVSVPAGTYSLFTLPSPEGWKLIINRQHGQWGTEYDPSQDLGRVDMQVRPLDEPVERLRFSIEPDQQGGRIVLRWTDLEAGVEVR